MMLFNDEFHIVIDKNVTEGHISCSENCLVLRESVRVKYLFSYLLSVFSALANNRVYKIV
jgi:hypothetical protein